MVDIAPSYERSRNLPPNPTMTGPEKGRRVSEYENPGTLRRYERAPPPRRSGEELSRDEATRELETLRSKGLYRGPGAERATRVQRDNPEEYVYETAPVSEEHVRTRAVHEIIPTVRREREIAEVRHAVLPIRERVKEAPVMTEKRLNEIREREYRTRISEEDRRKNQRISEQLSRGTRESLPVEHEYIYDQPRVSEYVRPRIIHEVHPVIQRDIDREHYEREYLPIHERIVEGPRVSNKIEVLKPMSRDEWERTHAAPIYREAGWRYGPDTDELFRQERTLLEDLSLTDRPPRTRRGGRGRYEEYGEELEGPSTRYRSFEGRYSPEEEYRRRYEARPRHTIGYLPAKHRSSEYGREMYSEPYQSESQRRRGYGPSKSSYEGRRGKTGTTGGERYGERYSGQSRYRYREVSPSSSSEEEY